MLNLYLFLGLAFICILVFGRLIEKIKVPWFFASLLLGFVLAIYNPFSAITSTQTFSFLSDLGMYLLLFMIGLEIDIKQFKKTGWFIIKSTFLITLAAAVLGSVLIYYFFSTSWIIALIVGTSFATVGEEILLPILDEFKIVNTKLGQAIIGIGSFDDLIELITLIAVIFLTGTVTQANFVTQISLVVGSLLLLFVLTFIITKFKEQSQRFRQWPVETAFLFSLFILFLYLGIGEYAYAAPIAALLAGITIGTSLPKLRLEAVANEIRALSYGFLAPIFFLEVGLAMNVNYLLSAPVLILLLILASVFAKLIGTYLVAHREMTGREIILLTTGLSIKFSTSIIIIKILLQNKLIDIQLYSAIVAASIVFTFIIPVLFSYLLNKWKIGHLSKA